ncbi:MAG: pyridoxal phosphate-dependent aminotransferase [Gammaproteobacteria bacterium]|nr:pyridoxal phosphate-dependent aminotransferase [Gammaproteobacteria bacterium]
MKKPFPLASHLDRIQPFHVMDLLARARALETAGRDIVHMEIGEPAFATPVPIVEAGQQALAQGHTHYTPALGLPALREAIAGSYQQNYGVSVDAARIIITPGSSGALLLALATLVDTGKRVMMTDPGYPCNRNFVYLLGGEVSAIPVTAASNYQPTCEQLQQHWDEQTTALMLASPSNPTGSLITMGHLQRLYDEVSVRQGRLIVDEIYHGLVYEDGVQTALSIADDLFVVNSFSKFYGMTGWRLGWLVAPTDYVPELDKLAQNLFLAAPTPAQYAALAAFKPETQEILQQRRDDFRKRRDYLVEALREIGFAIPVVPQGAFYIYADCSQFSDDSMALANTLLEEIGVAITPGLDFGQYESATHVRFSYTTSMERLKEGVARLRQFF